jgi:leucyl aminopeptidase
MATFPVLRTADASAISSSSSPFDALVVVAPAPIAKTAAALGLGAAVEAAIAAAAAADAALAKGPRPPVVLPVKGVPGGRLILAPTAALTDDVDDVRSIAEASSAAIARAVEAGATAPLLAVAHPAAPRFARAADVAALGALASQWAPLEAREAGKAPTPAKTIGVLGLEEKRLAYLRALETGRALCRDISGTEPERMAPLRIADLCLAAFEGTGVKVAIDRKIDGYPLLASVARASMRVERHRPCVVTLDWSPPGEIHRTVILAGKGVTYDTGGADLKTDGHMAGMSRDKCGAGAVAGLIRAAAELKVPGVRVVGLLGLVRNSIGEESFVSDEIIKSRAGVRVRIGNTDAEGRLVLADLLVRGKEMAENAPDPILLSVATLTGHVYRAFGPYTGAVPNGPARSRFEVAALEALGELWGEPIEESRPRREDYVTVAAKSSAEDVVSSNRLASVNTARGHQFPFAFLDVATGLKGGAIPFIHVDIAGTAVEGADWQFGKPTAVPIATLAAWIERMAQ